MGSLADVVIPTIEVPLSDGGEQTLTVRGLAYEDFRIVLVEHSDALEGLFQIFIKAKADTLPGFDSIVEHLMVKAPELAAKFIAIANDAPELVGVARKLPALVQTKCLISIAQLTLHSTAEVKKIVETLVTGMENLNEGISWMTMAQNVKLDPKDLALLGLGSGVLGETSASSSGKDTEPQDATR